MSTIAAEKLVDVFVEVADTLVDDFDLIDFVHLLTARTAELADAAAAGLLLTDPLGQLQFMAGSDERISLLELFQVQAHEGPCLDCYQGGEAVVNADLSTAGDVWPRFAPRAVAAGYRSVHVFPLRLRRDVIGVLGLFSPDTGRMDPEDAHILQGLADIATIALLQQRAVQRGEELSGQLQSALDSRVVIEQAKGAAAQIYGTGVDEAFELLRGYARRNHLSIGEVARAVVSNPTGAPDLRAGRRPDRGRPTPRRP